MYHSLSINLPSASVWLKLSLSDLSSLAQPHPALPAATSLDERVGFTLARLLIHLRCAFNPMADASLDPDYGAYIVLDRVPGSKFISLATCTRDSAFAWKSFGCQLVAWMLRLRVRITEIWHDSDSVLFIVLRVGDECVRHVFDNVLGSHQLDQETGALYDSMHYVYQCQARSHATLAELGM